MATNTISLNYVALLKDNSHICTCLLLVSDGLVCRHFFQVMLQTKTAKFSLDLIKSRWYKRSVNMDKTNIIYNSVGIHNIATNRRAENLVLTSISNIQNLNQDYSISNAEIENSIATRQIYGECAALGHKLASLAAEFRLTHIAATLQGLIQQIENASSNNTSQDQDIICNPLQASTKGRRAKRLKSLVENIPKSSKNKMTSTNVCSGDGYTCRNCFKEGHNARSCNTPCIVCKETGHTYLHCKNSEDA
ncbi:hypothetical protein C2G38_2324276 [Gigaspora rosea]|uniref:SWIM-type domain-containing protein n=1 Tax=Gigaspora rosea TaxID=44941 RepID=A0A397VZ36_9GLOM|nr:hypothetical protein C2G38_2324276 [Gigaspora rosea]